MSIELPELYSAFDLDTALAAAKTQIPVKSAGLWTDVSDTDPGVVAIRITLEAIAERLYSLSARTAPDALRVAFGQLLGVTPLAAQRSVGDLELIVAPATTIPTGFIVLNDETGLQYETTNPAPVSSGAGGALPLPARAVLAGSGGNIEGAGQISRILVQPGAGNVSSVSNKTAFSGGTDGETYDQYSLRLPGAIQRDILEYGFELENAAIENASVKRAKAFRATRPGVAVGIFERRESHITLVLVSTAGGTPAGAVLSAVYSSVIGQTWFNMTPDNPDRPYLHVIGARSRPVGVTARLVLAQNANPDAAITAATAALNAHLDPLTGGLASTGHRIGRRPQESEVSYALQALTSSGVLYVENLALVNAATFAVDEIVNANPAAYTLTTRFESETA